MTAAKKLSVEGSSMLRKLGVECKKRDTCPSISEMEPGESEDEVPVMRTAEFGPRPEDDKDDYGPVGVRFVETMDHCILADPYVASSCGVGSVGNC
jgi:hypothetical protein